MQSFLEYINKKLNEDNVILPPKIEKTESIKLPIKESVEVKPKTQPTNISIAKNILDGVSEEIKPYNSTLLMKEGQTSSYINDAGQEVVFNRNISSETKHAAMLLIDD